MSFPNRETIVLVGAIIGANLIGIVFQQPKPVRSLDCFQSFLPQTSNNRAISPPRTDIPYWQNNPWGDQKKRPGAWDVRLKKDVYFPVQSADQNHSALPLLAPASAAMAHPEVASPPPGVVGAVGAPSTAAIDAEIDAEIARDQGQTLAQYRASSQGGY